MKKLSLIILLVFAAVLALSLFAFAQGDPELTKNGTMQINRFAPKSITAYANGAGTTKITIPIATNVSEICFQPTAASGVRLGTAAGFSGDQKKIAAAGEWCRGIRKGVTQLQYSSTTAGTAVLEKQY